MTTDALNLLNIIAILVFPSQNDIGNIFISTSHVHNWEKYKTNIPPPLLYRFPLLASTALRLKNTLHTFSSVPLIQTHRPIYSSWRIFLTLCCRYSNSGPNISFDSSFTYCKLHCLQQSTYASKWPQEVSKYEEISFTCAINFLSVKIVVDKEAQAGHGSRAV
jgi:hypothetical protein